LQQRGGRILRGRGNLVFEGRVELMPRTGGCAGIFMHVHLKTLLKFAKGKTRGGPNFQAIIPQLRLRCQRNMSRENEKSRGAFAPPRLPFLTGGT
jgi:hypothetical protein